MERFRDQRVRQDVERCLKTLHSLAPSQLREDALIKLWNLADQDIYKQPLCSPAVGLLNILRNILDTETDVMILRMVTGILWFLSRDNVCKTILGSPETALIPSIARLVHTPSPFQSQIISMFSNLVLDKRTHDYLLTPQFRFFEMVLNEIRRRRDANQLYKCVSGFTQVACNENILRLIELGLHTILLNKLVSSSLNPTDWVDGGNGPTGWALSFAASFSSSSAGSKAIRDFNQPEYFIQLIPLNSIEGIQATIVVANTYGKEEAFIDRSLSQGLLTQYPSMLTLLLDLFDITLDFRSSRPEVRKYRRWNYGYGIIQLRDITSALRNLAFHPENQKLMIQTPRLPTMSLAALIAFLENRIEFQGEERYSAFHAVERGGGGGQDYDTLLNLLELIVQLSFSFEEDLMGLRQYLLGQSGKDVSSPFIPVLKGIQNLPFAAPERFVPREAFPLIQVILTCLEPGNRC